MTHYAPRRAKAELVSFLLEIVPTPYRVSPARRRPSRITKSFQGEGMGFLPVKSELYCTFPCARGSPLVPFALAGPASPMQRVCRILKMLRDKNEPAKGIIALVLNNTTRQS